MQASAFERFVVNRQRDKEIWLDTLPLQVAIHFTETLGAIIRHGTEPDLDALAAAEWVDAAREGIAITGQAVEAVREVLRDIAQKQPRRGKNSLTLFFGRLAVELSEYSDHPGCADIIRTLEEAALDVGGFPG
ncbi:hypothetical protein AB395_00005442 (plasmid) [Sinorhizobium fredii CCBAU 45436]|nr:hypothetical protein AB395_00005442 [Sinorhizobium fredii CCBAU 45436]